ncbi:MAG: AbrB/MazE/SpoVT family DNA-binding domain-containing protein [Dehalococcoidia bacterium]|nr:AbrB/MazE/SpoVT family DNA-binding domain-containing protein [Dehalococcoidia bacterium]
MTTKITSKGQVTIPKMVRDRLGLKPGDEIEFVEDKEGFRVQKLVLESPFDKYLGFLSHMAGMDPDSVVEDMRGR